MLLLTASCAGPLAALRVETPLQLDAQRIILRSDEKGPADAQKISSAIAKAGPGLARWGGLKEPVTVYVVSTHDDLETAVRRHGYGWLRAWGRYDDVIFHRVIPGFVIQGGDGQYGKKSALEQGRVGTGGPGYKFADEPIKGDYLRGSLAMANAGPNTNGSQFFICTDDLTGKLPKNYTLFGQVTKGLDVVDKIVSAPRNSKDLPDAPVAMTLVTIHED